MIVGLRYYWHHQRYFHGMVWFPAAFLRGSLRCWDPNPLVYLWQQVNGIDLIQIRSKKRVIWCPIHDRILSVLYWTRCLPVLCETHLEMDKLGSQKLMRAQPNLFPDRRWFVPPRSYRIVCSFSFCPTGSLSCSHNYFHLFGCATGHYLIRVLDAAQGNQVNRLNVTSGNHKEIVVY